VTEYKLESPGVKACMT